MEPFALAFKHEDRSQPGPSWKCSQVPIHSLLYPQREFAVWPAGVIIDPVASQSTSLFAPPSPVQSPWQNAEEQVGKASATLSDSSIPAEANLSSAPLAYYAVGQPVVYWQLGQVDLAATSYFYPSGSDSDKDS